MSAFYRDVLGLRQVTDEKSWKEFASGGSHIALHARDVAAARAKLNARGARYGKRRQFEALVMCDGRDPDGNPVQLSNR